MIKIILQFCKEHGLTQSFNALQVGTSFTLATLRLYRQENCCQLQLQPCILGGLQACKYIHLNQTTKLGMSSSLCRTTSCHVSKAMLLLPKIGRCISVNQTRCTCHHARFPLPPTH